MANSFQDLSLMLTPLKDTFPPQSLTGTGAGNAVKVTDVGTNRINARLSCGDGTAFTSLAVKMQASMDNSNWEDIEGATFTTVTTASGTPETIAFQLPRSVDSDDPPYQWVRAHATLVGTSIRMAVSLLACRKWDEEDAFLNSPGDHDAIN